MTLRIGLTHQRVCWTRMQAESGEGLARIVSRKDLERRVGEGLFFWGIGNAPSRAIPALARAAVDVEVFFSVMKSRPRAHDVTPSRVLAWRSFVKADGVVRALPAHALVTSRAGNRDCHYALMCHSEAPLGVADEGPFDPTAFRNCGAGGAVGASQVTALLERCAPDASSPYRIAMRARLTDGFWVKLIDPVELTRSARATLEQGVHDERDWLDFVACMRTGGSGATKKPAKQPSLFAI